MANAANTMSIGRIWGIFAVCFSVAALEGFDLQVLAVAVPGLRATLGLQPQQTGIALSAGLIGLAIGSLVGGTLADRIGRRRVLIVSVLALGVFTLLTAFATSFTTLLLARLMTGIAIGGAMPNLIAIIAAISGPRRMTSLVTAMMCGMPLGGVIAAGAGLLVIPTYGWPAVFVVGGVLTLILFPLLIFAIPEIAPRADHGDDAAISPAEALFGGGRLWATLALWITFILTLTVFSLLIGWAPTLVIDKGLPEAIGFSVMMALNLSGIVGALITGRMCDLFGVRPAMLVTYAGIAVGLALFAWATEPLMVILASLVAGFFVLGAQFALYGVAPRIYPLRVHGTGVGAAAAMGRIGSIMGPMLAGWLLASGLSVEEAVLSTIPMAVAAGLAMFLLTLLAPAKLGSSARGPSEEPSRAKS